MHAQAGNNNNIRNPLPISYTTGLRMLLLLPACTCISTYMYICIKPCFYGFWHYHPYALQHLNGNVFTLVYSPLIWR